MADSLIGSLRVALSLGTAEFETGANKAAQIAKSKAKEIEGAFASAKTAVAGFFAGFTVGLLTDQIKKSLDYAGSIAEVARTLGLTTTQLQTYRYAATQSGVAQDQLEVGLRRLTVSIGKAQLGSKAQADAFKAVGISVDQLKGKNTGQVFEMIADKLSTVSDRSQRAALEMILMGRSGSTLDNLLAPGSARLNELAEAAQRLGIVLSDSQIQGAEETAHKLEAVKMVLSAQIAGVVADNANAILSLSSALATLTGSIVKFLGSNPQLALGIIGGLLGGRVGGLPGAAIGAIGGFIAGQNVANSNADANTDPAFRKQQLLAARDRLIAARSNSFGTAPAMSVNGIQVAGGAGESVADAQAEFDKQVKLANRAAAQINAQALGLRSTQSGPQLPQFLAPKPARAKRPPKDLNEDVSFQFANEQRQADLAILQGQQQLSHDIGERAALALQMLQLEGQIRDATIDHQVAKAKQDLAEHKITQATYDEIVQQSAIIKSKGDEADTLKAKAIVEQRDLELAQQKLDISQHEFQDREDILQKQANLAKTAEERRQLELELLEITYQAKRQALQSIIDTSKDQTAIANARTDLASLDANHALDKASVLQQTRGPLDQYLASLPTSAAKYKEALQSVAVDGFGSLQDAILATIDRTKSLGAAFHDMAAQIIADLLKIAIQKYIIGTILNLAGSIGGGSGGSGGGGGGVIDLTHSPDIPHFDRGGSFMVLGNSGTDNNVLALNNVPIARVSYGEPIGIGSGKGGGGSGALSLTFHNDFRGAEASAVAAIQAKLDRMQAELPSQIIGTVQNAKQRFVLR